MMDNTLVIAVVTAYLLAMAAIGVYFSRRQTSTDAYFVAGRSIPGWAMGMSLFATLVSSVSFVAYPGAGYEGKWWAGLVPVLSAPLQAVVIVLVLIPVYRRVISISVYEYVEQRFDRPTRIYGTLTFFLLNFAKMAFVVYLVGLTVNAITGWNIRAVIVAVGAITVFYTFVGGLAAVIWTDVIQGVIMWAGGVVALAYMLFVPEGGPGRVLGEAWNHHKFDFGEISLSLSHPTLLIMLAVGFLEGMQKAASDQMVVQRYLVARTQSQASRGTVLSAVMTLLIAFLFTLMGTCLWSFYRITGHSLPADLSKSEEVFPHFLHAQLPAVFAAIVLAAILSAAMSTMSAALNAFASVAVADYYVLLRPTATDRQRLLVGRWFVVLSGVLCIAFGLVLVRSEGTAIQLWYVIASIVSAGIVGLFFLALMSRRAGRPSVYAGIITAVPFTIWAAVTTNMDSHSPRYQTFDLGILDTPLHSYLIGLTSTVLFVIVGYAVSLLWPETDLQKQSLTFWGWRERKATLERHC